MKNFFLALLVCALFACNNEGADKMNSDTTVSTDNTVNRDTSMVRDTGTYNTDTTMKKDSVR